MILIIITIIIIVILSFIIVVILSSSSPTWPLNRNSWNTHPCPLKTCKRKHKPKKIRRKGLLPKWKQNIKFEKRKIKNKNKNRERQRRGICKENDEGWKRKSSAKEFERKIENCKSVTEQKVMMHLACQATERQQDHSPPFKASFGRNSEGFLLSPACL